MHHPLNSLLAALGFVCLAAAVGRGESLVLRLRDQTPVAPGSNNYHVRQRTESWDPKATAVIVCDVWDYHHSINAVRRMAEFAPRIDAVVKWARASGATIIHAPSDCMAAYAEHPARARAQAAPRAANLPADMRQWCSVIPAEKRGVYPVDQSDGGEDDDLQEHAAWAEKLKALGRNPAHPWQRESDMVEIDAAADYISDRGDEVWNILEARGIQHVILTGVHVNMCVLGRPFGLRRMVLAGKQAVLLADVTDAMYNPKSWPYVSHFTGNDRVIEHIERHVCPTITSDQIVGGKPFHFSGDKRPHLAIVIGEENYGTALTLPEFARRQLGRDFRVSYVFAAADDPHKMPGIDGLDEADLMLLSVRRRALESADMATVRRFVAAGKPVIGLRTASHAFALREQAVSAGYETWPEFDVQVFGGHYTGHSSSKAEASLRPAAGAADHPLLTGIPSESQSRAGGLYQFTGLSPQGTLILQGEQEQDRQPIAWTFTRTDGGRSFYTSLGETKDFENAAFQRLLLNAVYWSAGLPVPRELPKLSALEEMQQHWSNVDVPGAHPERWRAAADNQPRPAWYRCVVRLPESWADGSTMLDLPGDQGASTAWLNGAPLMKQSARPAVLDVPSAAIAAGDANLLVVRRVAPNLDFDTAALLRHGQEAISLAGCWQCRLGDDARWSNIPLPAKFGGSADVVFDGDARK